MSLNSMAHKVLVVDDEPDLQILIRQKFRAGIAKGELSFDFALNGAEALEKVDSDPSYELILTDINMPVMDGLAFLNGLKERNNTAKAVVISAYSEISNIRIAMNRGAFDFITKPIELSDLEVTMHKAFREMEIFRQGMEAKENLVITTIEKDKAIMEKLEAQQQALQNLQEKEKLILFQNELLEKQVAERTAEVIHQKELVEIKNKEILDSIYYAKHVQEAILPDVKQIHAYFPDSFVLYCAKDIVAGDFYWMEKQGDKKLVVAADCTGHGVAGALMSMIGISLLNQLVNEKKVSEPSDILAQLHEGVVASLKQTDNNSNDGMDIAICSYDGNRRSLTFSGANRPLWIVRNNALLEYPANKVPVGGLQVSHSEKFIQHEIALEKNDAVYIFTDGFADQFGGEMNKKLMTKKFKETLLSISDLNMSGQQVFLKNYFDEWKGTQEQVDDVLVIGIRVAF
jgi:sigma-B regulation protein RsbU (phosphoserine phosphatase)